MPLPSDVSEHDCQNNVEQALGGQSKGLQRIKKEFKSRYEE